MPFNTYFENHSKIIYNKAVDNKYFDLKSNIEKFSSIIFVNAKLLFLITKII